MVAKLGKTGTVERIVTLEDSGDGGGKNLVANAEGLTVDGFIDGAITFAGEIVGGSGYHELSALFDSQLQPIAATAEVPIGDASDADAIHLGDPDGTFLLSRTLNKASQLPPDPPHPDGHLGIPTSFIVTAGESMGGGLEALQASDNRYMRIQAIDHTIRFFVYFDPGDEPVFLSAISLELHTTSCYTATVFLDRANSSQFDVLGQRGMCPTNEPVLSVEIPREASRALGYDGINPNPPWRLRVGVILEFPEPTPPDPGSCILLSQSAQDASVDEVMVEVEY